MLLILNSKKPQLSLESKSIDGIRYSSLILGSLGLCREVVAQFLSPNYPCEQAGDLVLKKRLQTHSSALSSVRGVTRVVRWEGCRVPAGPRLGHCGVQLRFPTARLLRGRTWGWWDRLSPSSSLPSSPPLAPHPKDLLCGLDFNEVTKKGGGGKETVT